MMKPINLIPDTLPDLLATLFGAIGGVAQLCVYTNRLSQDDGFFISGLATIALGVICNKADIPQRNPHKPPNYSPLDFARYDEPPYNDPYYESPSESSPKAPRKRPGKHDDESEDGVSNITDTPQYHSKYIGQSQKVPKSNSKQVNESDGFRGRRTRKRFKPSHRRLDADSDSNSQSPSNSDS